MCIRDSPSAGGDALRGTPPALGSALGGCEFRQTPSCRDGRLARWASCDRDLPGWIMGPRPILTR
eukprot:14517076-Alexandrium_andersonii.AAC.1